MQESAPERERDEARAARPRQPRGGARHGHSPRRPPGLLPTRAAVATCTRPERFVVGHPFNPVYLLPLVEVCGGEQTEPQTVERAGAIYRSRGHVPAAPAHEIDGFVADRLLEALWREALWLVNDDIATVSEIDDAIRFGAGLRWASMGTFLTYRIAGGEAGMRHFMEQFGPALQWPWTKLMDVPELTDGAARPLVGAVRTRRPPAARCASSSGCATTASSPSCRPCAPTMSAPAPCSRG